LLYWRIVLSLLLVVGIEAELITMAQALRIARLRGITRLTCAALPAMCAGHTPRRSAVPVVTAPRPADPLQDEQDPEDHPFGPSL
jgi:hypothetical protein